MNGAAVSQSALDAALDSVASDPGYGCLVEAASGGAVHVTGAAPGTYNETFAAGVLSLLIEADAIHLAAGALGLAEGTVATTLAQRQITADLTPQANSTCLVTGAQVFGDLSGPYRRALVQLQVDEDAIAAHAVGAAFSNAGIAAYERHHRAATTLDCTDAIEVASRDKAAQLAIGDQRRREFRQGRPGELARHRVGGRRREPRLRPASQPHEAARRDRPAPAPR